MPKKVTQKDFVQAWTAHVFRGQLSRAPLNRFHHEREPVTVASQLSPRPNIDVLYSHAVVDVSAATTFEVAASDEYQADQLIDENHYTVGVVYPGQSLTVTPDDLSSGSHVYVLGRTSVVGGLARARALQDARTITATTANPYVPVDFDDESLRAAGARLARRAAEFDRTRAFGTPSETDPEQHLLGTRLEWGGLPSAHGRYFEGSATSTGCDIWTFEVPPVDLEHHGTFSVVRYDADGWLDVDPAGIAAPEFTRNGDGSISVYFGDDNCIARGNVVRTTKGQRFRYGIRLYRPRDPEETERYLEALRAEPLETVIT